VTMPERLPKPGGAKEVPAHLSYYDQRPTAAVAVISSYSDSQRLARAVTAGLLCWGLAIVSVFIPLGHFFLVPAFAIGGPVMFFMRLGEGVTLHASRGACPVCGVKQEFAESGRLRPRHPVRCSSCGRRLELTLTSVTTAEARVQVSMGAAAGPGATG
jgi:hypothetical protein